MKRILLTTTALTMTAGIAAAEVSVTGDFRLGFNDTQSNTTGLTPLTSGTKPALAVIAADGKTITPAVPGVNYVAGATHDNKFGMYNDAGVTFAMSSTLDNGMAASITLDVDGDTGSQAKDAYKFSLSNDSTLVEFGTTEYSTITNWTAAGDMKTDTWSNQNADNKNVLRAETTVGGLKVSVSSNIISAQAAASPDPIALTIGGSLGNASYVVANEGSKMGIAVATAVGGATVTTAYSTAPSVITANGATGVAVGGDHTSSMGTSTAVKIAYPMGAVVATASYSMEAEGDCADETVQVPAIVAVTTCAVNADTWDISAVWTSGDTSVTFATDENSKNSIEGSTMLGGATLKAGLSDAMNDMYLQVSNPLGGGASIMASYAVDHETNGTDAADEIGAPDLQEGLTVELTFAF